MKIKHSSSCSGERYIVLLLLIPRLSPPVLYALLSKLASGLSLYLIKAKPCACAFRSHCGKDFFCCCCSDHNESDFAFLPAPSRMFFTCYKSRNIVRNSTFEKIEKHSSSCSGERYIVLLLLIPRLSPPVLLPRTARIYAKLAKCIFSMRSRISRSLWQGFFRCCCSDHNESDFAFLPAPSRMFFIFLKLALKSATRVFV